MNNFERKSIFLWTIGFLSISIILIFSYFNFSNTETIFADPITKFFINKIEPRNKFPIPRPNTEELQLSAESFISVFVPNETSSSNAKNSTNDQDMILVEKNKDKQLPIASITKLMTALIASEKYKINDTITVTEDSLKIDGLSGIYKAGDRFFFYNAMRAMLIASHNEIANTLASQTDSASFINSMNKKASELSLINTGFINPTGLDPEISSGPINHSTTFDIYKLAKYIKENDPNIFYITTQKEFDLFDVDKNFISTIKNTDKLLSDPGVPFIIVGGKTGETDLAKQNLILITDTPCEGKIFSVVLGSQNRFEDMKKILQYINSSFDWSCPEK